MRRKIDSRRSRRSVSGWRWPRSGARPGSVTSMASPAGRRARLRTGGLVGARGRLLRDHRLGLGGHLREAREGGRRGDGELREALAVERVARGLQARDELAVCEAVLARRGVDPHHPQAAEVALLAAAADKSLLERGVDRLFRGPIELDLGLVEPFGPAEQLLPLLPPYLSSFYFRHHLSFETLLSRLA